MAASSDEAPWAKTVGGGAILTVISRSSNNSGGMSDKKRLGVRSAGLPREERVFERSMTSRSRARVMAT
jgi:hypothetical protein